MWAGMWAVLLQATNNSGGWPKSLESLYTLGKAGQGFHDITSGNNSDGTTPGFNAVAGYDLATGWGSPNLPSLISNWK
jgi:kumamolisin